MTQPIIKQFELGAETATVIQIVTAGREGNFDINLLNPTAVDITVKLWFSATDVPENAELIEGPKVLAQGDVLLRTNVMLPEGTRIIAQGDVAGLVVCVNGIEEVV